MLLFLVHGCAAVGVWACVVEFRGDGVMGRWRDGAMRWDDGVMRGGDDGATGVGAIVR
jgi:hypothetical protein